MKGTHTETNIHKFETLQKIYCHQTVKSLHLCETGDGNIFYPVALERTNLKFIFSDQKKALIMRRIKNKNCL